PVESAGRLLMVAASISGTAASCISELTLSTPRGRSHLAKAVAGELSDQPGNGDQRYIHIDPFAAPGKALIV
ncbi:hypothetical protein, partial [Paraburkholderia piptadeniae]|uniref:hypothetical protein n=1 Tax=Paraburkholderia piptadeniae TaxID=1701573 RepID=UPI001C475597